MEIPSFGVTPHFTDKVNQILDLAVGVRLPPFDNNSHTDHVAWS
jgi:hypothetical protein